DGLRGAPRSGGTGRPRPAPSYPRGGARAAGGHRVSLTERWDARGGSPSGQKDVDHHESSADEGPQEVSQADDEAEFAVRDAPNQLLDPFRRVGTDLLFHPSPHVQRTDHVGALTLEPGPQRFAEGRFDAARRPRREPV